MKLLKKHLKKPTQPTTPKAHFNENQRCTVSSNVYKSSKIRIWDILSTPRTVHTKWGKSRSPTGE